MSELPGFSPQLVAAIRDLPTISPQKQEREINRIITEAFPTMRQWAWRWAAGTSYHFGGREDALQEAAVCLLETLRERAGGAHSEVRNWNSYVFRAGLFRVRRAALDSTVSGSGSGEIAAGRRRSRLRKTLDGLRAELQRSPDWRELQTAHNAEMARRSSNPGKQGLFVSEAECRLLLDARRPTQIGNKDSR